MNRIGTDKNKVYYEYEKKPPRFRDRFWDRYAWWLLVLMILAAIVHAVWDHFVWRGL